MRSINIQAYATSTSLHSYLSGGSHYDGERYRFNIFPSAVFDFADIFVTILNSLTVTHVQCREFHNIKEVCPTRRL